MSTGYDPEKRRKTLKERGLDFEDAYHVIDGSNLTDIDDRFDYGEERLVSVGQLSDQVVVVVWTLRDGDYRIISMRAANDKEKERYHREMDRPG